jgi:hypothetical protein
MVDPPMAEATPECWSYPGPSAPDHSNTQFALMGLASAARLGIAVPVSVWTNAVRHYVEAQESSGPAVDSKEEPGGPDRPVGPPYAFARGWCYNAFEAPLAGSGYKMTAVTGSMTCAGLTALVLSVEGAGWQNLSDDLTFKVKDAIRDGLAWLDLHWTVESNTNCSEKLWHYYFLAGLERAAALTASDRIGSHDWFKEGAAYLLDAQDEEGFWDDPNCAGPVANTCFALLFLSKATHR